MGQENVCHFCLINDLNKCFDKIVTDYFFGDLLMVLDQKENQLLLKYYSDVYFWFQDLVVKTVAMQ